LRLSNVDFLPPLYFHIDRRMYLHFRYRTLDALSPPRKHAKTGAMLDSRLRGNDGIGEVRGALTILECGSSRYRLLPSQQLLAPAFTSYDRSGMGAQKASR
jgi:hypothetical protein